MTYYIEGLASLNGERSRGLPHPDMSIDRHDPACLQAGDIRLLDDQG